MPSNTGSIAWREAEVQPPNTAATHSWVSRYSDRSEKVAGSDWPVSSPDPLAAIHVAVNRWALGEDGPAGSEPFLPEQALDLETAFAAYTSGSAWVCHRDDAGLLEPGREADLVLLDRDPFTGPVDEIGAASVVGTWVGGTRVH